MVKRNFKVFGCILVGCGALIILSMVLPGTFWWFILGAALICAGIAVLRK